MTRSRVCSQVQPLRQRATGRHHRELGHHAVVLVVEHVAVDHEVAGVVGECGRDLDRLVRVEAPGVLEAALPGRWRLAVAGDRNAVDLPRQSARLERLSMGEVALLTKQAPVWRSAVTQQTARSATITFERKAAPQVALLNAARVQGLAARTRAYLANRGFRNAAIGNAPTVRKQSAILFAEGDRVRAERIAAQFGFALEHRPGAADGRMTILLGRDAAIDRALRPNG